MDTLSLFDLGFFTTETAASPKHVGLFLICTKPKGAKSEFVSKLLEHLKSFDRPKPPFDQTLRLSMRRMPYWKHVKLINVSEHVFLHSLQSPGTREQLHRLVGELHEPKLGREKPLWEYHLIDGLAQNKFAVYLKLHHAYADGISMFRFLTDSLSTNPLQRHHTPVWAIDHTGFNPDEDGLGFFAKRWSKQLRRLNMTRGLAKLGTQLALEQLRLTKNAVAVPFTTKHSTPLTGQVNRGRQVSTAMLPMAQINTIRKETGTTVNQLAVSCIDTALHRYLEELECNVDGPLTIQMPVNLRHEGDERLGNKMGIVPVDLSNRNQEPCMRLKENSFKLKNIRKQISGVSPESVEMYTILLNTLAQFTELVRLSDHLPLIADTLVSNIPGGSETLYMEGACVDEMYTISALPPSNRLNITMYSYAGSLYFGLVASKELPNLERLANYIEDALAELEHAVFPDKDTIGEREPITRQLAG